MYGVIAFVTSKRIGNALGVLGIALLAAWWLAILSCEYHIHQELKLHPNFDLGCSGTILLSRVPVSVFTFSFGLVASWRSHKSWLALCLAASLTAVRLLDSLCVSWLRF
jgi:hypothetical protein